MSTEDHKPSWLRRFHTAPARPLLFCFPHAGGAASFFYDLSAALAPEVQVVGLQYPGRQDRFAETPLTEIPALTELIVPEIRAALAADGAGERPWALLGHSMGAALAFDVACRLERDGERPAVLFASGRRAPSVPVTDGVHLRDDDGLLDAVGRFDPESAERLSHAALRPMVLPSLRADYVANATYRPGVDHLVACPVLGLTGDRDPVTEIGDAQAWAAHTTGAFELRVFPGGHFFLTEQLPSVAAVIAERLVTVSNAAPGNLTR